MSCEKNDLLAKLQQAMDRETQLLETIRDVCANPNWIDDPDERVNQMGSLAFMSAEWADSQTATDALMKTWNETQNEQPKSLRRAIEVKREVQVAAIEAIRRAEEQTRTSKGALMRYLAHTNQTQEMLGAYRQC